MSSDAKFAIIWVTFTLLVLVGFIPMLVWAIRSRQFSNQDRARHLPLRSGPPRDEARPNREPHADKDGNKDHVSP